MIIDFALAKRNRRPLSNAPWCGPCSDQADERQYLVPLLAPNSRVMVCPSCGEEFG